MATIHEMVRICTASIQIDIFLNFAAVKIDLKIGYPGMKLILPQLTFVQPYFYFYLLATIAFIMTSFYLNA